MGFFDLFAGKKEYGVLTTSNGSYEGEIVKGKPHGKGSFSFHDGSSYKGDFVKGAFTGKGIMIYTVPTSGYKYEGDFVAGNRHGKGTYTFPSGNCYVGDFVDNDIHGYGTMHGPDGAILQKGRWVHYRFVGN